MKKTFNDVLADIEKNLIGKTLHGISGTASVFTILKVDYQNKNVVLDVQGNKKTWTFERMEKVWKEMYYRPAANVEVVFGGSGSSRNQVETIYANLGYVEWLYVKSKKCIAYVGEDTHPYGELKHMDEEKESEYQGLMMSNNPLNPIISEDESFLSENIVDKSEKKVREKKPNYHTGLYSTFERNRIVFGAPGTGKSHQLKSDCKKELNGTMGDYERVTFHPDYSYSQFVGTYKPLTDPNGSIKYAFVPGPFMRMYVQAIKSGWTEKPQPFILIIEEINRAKVAAVFGDIFQLLDRNDDGVSEYDIHASEDVKNYLARALEGRPEDYQKIKIPDNMFIWCTMNSADQGVFPMDTAFKRRWNFEYLGINKNEKEISGIGKIMLAGCEELVEWNILRRAINDKMSSEQFKINEDKLMGPFFLSKRVLQSDESGMIVNTEKFMDAFKSKVIMYLYEDAVKQGKHRFFDGCDSRKYSSVCDAFDELGMGIFGPNFKENYYDKQKDEV